MKQLTSNIDPETIGSFFGFLGVLGFSLTLLATRVAVIDFDPVCVGLGRAVVASVLAVLALWLTRQPFFAWYHGMGVAGVGRVSQMLLLQPFLTILFSVWLLGEQVTSLMLLATYIVIACVIFGKQALVIRRHNGE